MKIVLVEPYGHLAGHYPVEARKLARALERIGHSVSLATVAGFRAVPGLDDRGPDSIIRFVDSGPIWQRLLLRICGPIVTRTAKVTGVPPFAGQILLTWFALGLGQRIARRDSAEAVLLVSGSLLGFLAFAAFRHGFTLCHVLRYVPRPAGAGTMVRFRQHLRNLLLRRGLKANPDNLCFTHIGSELFEAYRRGGFVAPSHEVVPVGIDHHPDLVDRRTARDALGLDRDARFLLVFGAGHTDKDFRSIMEALRIVGPGISALFAGTVLSDNDPRLLARLFGVEDRVVVRDRFIAESELGDYFRAADGLLMSYKRGFIVHSGVLALGAEYRLPVIASDAGEIGKAVRDWDLGMTFEAENPTAMAEAMTTFCDLDEAKRQALTANLDRYRDAHSWASVAENYARVLGQANGP